MPAGTAKCAPDQRAFIQRLSKTGCDLDRIAKEVERSPELARSVMAAIGGDATGAKFAASKLLKIVSQRYPELVYPHFDLVMALLKNKNSFLRWNAILTLANLSAVDRKKKFESILDTYLAPIRGSLMIDAANTMRGAAVIAQAKAHLANNIAAQMLEVENASYATAECRNVALGHAITALGQIFANVSDKTAVEDFVGRQMNNARAATRGKARKFCSKWSVRQALATR
jgi:hypothetical protein